MARLLLVPALLLSTSAFAQSYRIERSCPAGRNMAVELDHEVIASILVDNYANLDAKNAKGVAPLHIAAMKGYSSLAELFLINGANPNQPGQCGYSALMMACWFGQDDTAVTLLDYGASSF